VSLLLVAAILAASIAFAFLVVSLCVKGFPMRCDLCGGKYGLGHLDKHFANDCTTETRRIWNAK
jgi:hypothetical protein